MSAKFTGHVWDLQLPRMEIMILLAMADHAHHDGTHVFASQALISWKTGYSIRQIRRVQEELKQRKILIPEGSGYRGAQQFRLDFSQVPLKPPFATRDTVSSEDKMSVERKSHINRMLRHTEDKMSAEESPTEDKMSPVKMSSEDISRISHNKDARAESLEDLKKTTTRTAHDRRFDAFWKVYPRKERKLAAKKAWMNLKPDDALLDTILAAIEQQKQSKKWLKDGGEYIPHPSSWLNDHRWEDEAMTPLTKKPELAL